jgi:FlaA1/EpsC-like NDP-sugar epimerase
MTKVSHGWKKFVIDYRLPLIVLAHLLIVVVANYAAFWLRFDGDIPDHYKDLMWGAMPWLLLVRGTVFAIYRLYRGLWRYTSIWDTWHIISATLLSAVIFYLFIHVIEAQIAYPRSVFIVDSLLGIFLLTAMRLPWRIHREFKVESKSKKKKRILIYGAGDAGEMILRDIKQHPEYHYKPIGFLDDDRSKVGQRIHGIRVCGTRQQLTQIIENNQVDEIILAIPSADPSTMREIVRSLQQYNMPIKTTPNLRDILDEKVTLSQIRNLSVEDLLPRVPVDLDMAPVQRLLKGKTVFITGAGGSIGSELCRQIAKMEPAELLLFDRYENGLYDIANELKRFGHKIRTIIGDVTDARKISQLFQALTPEVVFHAAAHKHVPLMEDNPCEAIKNNVIGTRILAKAAVKHGVGKFVLISTDKAVNPTSVMGASKRVAELIVSSMADQSMTSFVAVRFGNVLASKGSVVPLFLEQIRRGGPVTITHPQMKRYFMLIPEAVQLVLVTSALGGDAVTYVLQMGEQVNVTEMASNLIRLSGFIPEVDIPIVYSGLRPGEKLYEELIGDDETAEPSRVPEVLKIKQKGTIDPIHLRRKVREIEIAANEGDQGNVVECLKAIVPNFKRFEPPPQGAERQEGEFDEPVVSYADESESALPSRTI